jgi:hypothetical protein
VKLRGCHSPLLALLRDSPYGGSAIKTALATAVMGELSLLGHQLLEVQWRLIDIPKHLYVKVMR